MRTKPLHILELNFERTWRGKERQTLYIMADALAKLAEMHQDFVFLDFGKGAFEPAVKARIGELDWIATIS